MKNDSKIVIAYTRVSTEDQVDGTSLDSQKEACKKFAADNEWILPEKNIFTEKGVSAKLIDRPELAKLLEFCAKNKGKISHCIVWKVDRLARKSEYHHVIKSALAKQGVKLVSVTEPIGDDPIGNLMDGVLAAFAQFDNDIRLIRTNGGLKARAMQGGWPHDAPYGYKKATTPTKITTIEPNKYADNAKAFLEEFATGAYTVKQAADLAYDMGIRNKKGGKRKWQSICNMLVNPLYAGYVQSKLTDGQMIRGVHQAIISEHTHYKIKAIIAGNQHYPSKQAQPDWPLRGGFIKHTCGLPMTGSAPKGRSGYSPRYSCMTCKSRELGIPVSKRRELVHNEFLAVMSAIKPKPGAQKLFKEIVLRQWNDEFREAVIAAERVDIELAAIKKKKSRILDLFIDGKIDEEAKNVKMQEAEAEVGKLEVQRIQVDDYITEKEQVIDGALLFMTDAGLFWNLASIELKKRVQDTIFPEGITYDCANGFRTAKVAESYQLMLQIEENNNENPTVVAATGLEPVTPSL